MTKARQPLTARGTSKSTEEANLKRAKAYKRLFQEGNATQDDADIVLTDLAAVAGFFRPPSFAEWMQRTKTPQGFELHCALQAARGEVIRHIFNHLDLSDDQMIALERAAREASQR